MLVKRQGGATYVFAVAMRGTAQCPSPENSVITSARSLITWSPSFMSAMTASRPYDSGDGCTRTTQATR